MTAALAQLTALRDEVRLEAGRLFDWWRSHMPDQTDGFWGEVDASGQPVPDAPRSIILYTRLLWFFSAMANWQKSDETLTPTLALAQRAADYIRRRFLDSDHGGVYWLLDAGGRAIDTKKQGYAQAFAIYAFAEHYGATGDAASLAFARQALSDIENRFWDPVHGGYIEALSASWTDAGGDQRLSDKDADCPKTMNTHLHVLEAYTSLHRIAPDAASHAALGRALDVFAERFVEEGTHHLRLFYDMDWTDRTQGISYGHDIEASWLMWEAAVALDDPVRLARVRPLALGLAQATLEGGFNADGGICYERGHDGHLDPAGEWWGQAEGMVGFVNAWQMTGDVAYLAATERLWSHLKAQYGAGGHEEWTWYAANAGKSVMYKAGQWKCPYHNGRAMIELDHRLKPVRF